MAGYDDVEVITEDKKLEKKGRKFDKDDWRYVAESIVAEYEVRKRDRGDREKHWAEIDRQVKMIPSVPFKYLADGKVDTRKRWMAEIELPLQAQCLEVNCADARRFLFPDNMDWFEAHAELTDEYLSRVDFTKLVKGDENEVPSKITQDNADKLVEGFILDNMRQTDFPSRMDRVNAEAYKYGMGLARGRKMRKTSYIHEARGTRKEKQLIPVFVPVSIKNVYLPTPDPSTHTATVLGEAYIAVDRLKLASLVTAANKGSSDPMNEDGGWMPANLKEIEADKDDMVTVLEWEGDLVVPRKTTRSMIIPNAIVTVVINGKPPQGGGAGAQAVVRCRFRKSPYSSYIEFPYQYEATDDAYPTGPLEKGRPIQIAASDAINRMLDSAMLKIAPPTSYDRTDPVFTQSGGPVIEPYAVWGSTENIVVHDKVGGDPSVMAQAMTLMVNLYGELTGVLPARLGAQTVSHTTAFAKDAELQRGSVRTVNYVKKAGQGGLLRWLDMCYDMGRAEIPPEGISFWIPAYGGFVEISKDQLPDRAAFEWLGAGGPQEEAAKQQRKLQSGQLALQLDQLSIQMGNPPHINIGAMEDQVLRDGGWTDVDAITVQEAAVAAPADNPGAVSVALQSLANAEPQ